MRSNEGPITICNHRRPMLQNCPAETDEHTCSVISAAIANRVFNDVYFYLIQAQGR